MFPRDASARLISLVRSGLLDLTQYEVTDFKLSEANKAVAHAAANGALFKLTVIRLECVAESAVGELRGQLRSARIQLKCDSKAGLFGKQGASNLYRDAAHGSLNSDTYVSTNGEA